MPTEPAATRREHVEAFIADQIAPCRPNTPRNRYVKGLHDLSAGGTRLHARRRASRTLRIRTRATRLAGDLARRCGVADPPFVRRNEPGPVIGARIK